MSYFDNVLKYGFIGLVTTICGLIIYHIAQYLLILIAILVCGAIVGAVGMFVIGVVVDAVIRAFNWGLKKWKER